MTGPGIREWLANGHEPHLQDRSVAGRKCCSSNAGAWWRSFGRASDNARRWTYFGRQGDALEEASYLRVLDGRKASAAFSDAPFNIAIAGFVSGLGQHKHPDFEMACGEMDDDTFTAFLVTYLGHCCGFTSKGAIIFACMDWRQIDLLLEAGRTVGLTRNNICVWDKGAGGMTGSIYRSRHEFVVVFVNGKSPATNNVQLGAHGRDRANIWQYPGANRKGSSAAEALADHPTPKPVELVEDALLDVTNPGDVLLDPFAGGDYPKFHQLLKHL